MPIAMEPAKGVQIDAVVVSPHKFIGGPAASGIQAVGASLLYLPPYSPDFNPIEMAFPNSRRCCALPRRSMHDLWQAIANAINRFTPDECRNYLVAAGYDAT